MNSFLFNVMLVLIASVSITQFCSVAFQDYSSMTEIDFIFSTQIKYLKCDIVNVCLLCDPVIVITRNMQYAIHDTPSLGLIRHLHEVWGAFLPS